MKRATSRTRGGGWQLQHAKARLSELIKLACTEGPQEITVRGDTTAVVLSRADYDKLCNRRKASNLSDFLLRSPLARLNVDFERDRSLTRDDSLFDAER
jgi:prevent-host-death family protein